jgi:hypothetical protein
LNVGGLGVFFVIDEVLGEGLGHELLGLIFLLDISTLKLCLVLLGEAACHVGGNE